MFPEALESTVLSRSTNALCVTGFVADIYNSSVAQGPSLPEANRSATMAIYNRNLTLLHSRLLGALAAVRSCAVPDTSASDTAHSNYVQMLARARLVNCFPCVDDVLPI